MRHRYFLIILISILLSACDDTPRSRQAAAHNSSKDTNTVQQELYPEYSFASTARDTQLTIDGQAFSLQWSTRLAPSEKMTFEDIYDIDEGIQKDMYQGFNAHFNITLQDQSGSKVFSKELTKSDFKPSFDEQILVRSEAKLPIFRGYLPAFNAFLFTFEFWIPDSDVGGEYVLLLNRQGDIIESYTDDYFGGGDYAGQIEIPDHQQFVLTRVRILHPGGRKVELGNKENGLIGTKLLNNECILVVREYSDSTQTPNAILMNPDGTALKNFIYQGYYEVLGYEIPLHFEPSTQNYYLLDEESEQLRVIPKTNPTATYTVNFSGMPTAGGKKQPGEVAFSLNTEMGKHVFYVKAGSSNIRKD